MADPRGGVTGCSDRCGCPVPCHGGASCRCETSQATAGGGEAGHNKCSCGEHCGCNPCTCPKSSTTSGVGKAHCKCGHDSTCSTCRA